MEMLILSWLCKDFSRLLLMFVSLLSFSRSKKSEEHNETDHGQLSDNTASLQ